MILPQLNNRLKADSPKNRYRGRFSPIGLDIGSDQIKLVQLTQSGGAPALYRHAVFPAPAGEHPGENNGLSAALSEALKGVTDQAGCSHNRVQLGLHSQAVTLRRISLPRISPPQIARTMRLEAEKQLPQPLEETVYDYAFQDSRTDGGNAVLDFVLAAVPKAVAERCTEAAAKAGLYPEAIEAAPFALCRAVTWCGAARPHLHHDTLLVVNIGAESSDLLVLHRGRCRFYRPISLGVNHFALDAAAFSRLKPGDAQLLLWSPEPLSQRGLDQTALKLARQIARSLEFFAYETKYPEKQCRAAMICGGGALIPGLDSFLTGELGLETSRFDPLAPPYLNDGGETTAAGPLFATALGLALRGWTR